MRAALSFLTRIPVGSFGRFHVENYYRTLGRQVPYFPLVGALVGAVTLAVDAAAGRFFGLLVRAGLAVGAGVLVTGALHLDGLMDTADGVGSHRSPDRMLEIMKDSRVGAMGVVSGVLSLLLRFALVAELPTAARWQALLLAPALGRMALAAAAGLFPAARPAASPGLGAAFAAHVGRWQVAGALATGLALAAVIGLVRGLAAWGVALAVACLMARSLTRTLGGLTGDTYGAINEVAEVAVLTLFAAGGVLA